MLKTLLKSALVVCAIVAVTAVEAARPVRRRAKNARRTVATRKAAVVKVCTSCQL